MKSGGRIYKTQGGRKPPPIKTRDARAARKEELLWCENPVDKRQAQGLRGSSQAFYAGFKFTEYQGDKSRLCPIYLNNLSQQAITQLRKQLEKSCTSVIGKDKDARAMCTILVNYLKSKEDQKSTGSTLDRDYILLPITSKRWKKFWTWKNWENAVHDGWDKISGGLGFAIGMYILDRIVKRTTGKGIFKRIIDKFSNGNGDGKPPASPTGDTDSTPDTTSETADTAAKMVTLMGMLAEMAKRFRPPPMLDFKPISFPTYNPTYYAPLYASYTVDYTGMMNSWDHLQLQQEYIKSARASEGSLAIAKMIIGGGVVVLAAAGTAFCWANLAPDPGDVAAPAALAWGVRLLTGAARSYGGRALAAGTAAYAFGLFDSDEAHADPLHYDPLFMDDIDGDDLLSPIPPRHNDDYSQFVCE